MIALVELGTCTSQLVRISDQRDVSLKLDSDAAT